MARKVRRGVRPWGPLLAVLISGCDREATSAAASASPSAEPPDEARATILLQAELSRDFEAVTQSDLRARDVEARRLAVRALARIRDDRARPALSSALSDEDATVVAWAAYGLGDLCAGARDATVSALVTVAALRAAAPTAEGLSPERAITRAIGRCAGERSEAVLVGWARDAGPLASDAIAALGDIARSRKRLREETQVALLGLAEGDALHPPLAQALYPLGQVVHLTPSVVERAREVAKKQLDAAALAVRVLARTGEEAAPILAEVVTSPERDPAMRVEAVRALATLGRVGQRALAEALEKVTIVVAADPAAHVPLAILAHLTDTRKIKPRLTQLATLQVETKSEAEKRRLSLVRCGAAKLLAERRYALPELRQCDLLLPEGSADPLPSPIAAAAVVDALGVDGVKLEGPRLEAWKLYAQKGAPLARAAALGQLARHDEVSDAPALLAEALTAAEPGVVAAAAEVIAKHPARARTGAKLDEAVKKALSSQLEAQEDLEARAAVIDAVGALALQDAKAALVEICGSPRSSLRAHAEAALAKLMPEGAPRCPGGVKLASTPDLDRDLGERAKLTLKTDVGDLTLSLDPSLAPAAVSRVISLVEGNFYDGMVVHRVVPGFVAQFGSPTADGFGGVKGLPPLPCETSPVPFTAGSVGVALAGRDTGSSQLFVTFAPTPHLDGDYAWLGTAEGPWAALVEGDVIHDAVVQKK